jgi:hypothetical protein
MTRMSTHDETAARHAQVPRRFWTVGAVAVVCGLCLVLSGCGNRGVTKAAFDAIRTDGSMPADDVDWLIGTKGRESPSAGPGPTWPRWFCYADDNKFIAVRVGWVETGVRDDRPQWRFGVVEKRMGDLSKATFDAIKTDESMTVDDVDKLVGSKAAGWAGPSSGNITKPYEDRLTDKILRESHTTLETLRIIGAQLPRCSVSRYGDDKHYILVIAGGTSRRVIGKARKTSSSSLEREEGAPVAEEPER